MTRASARPRLRRVIAMLVILLASLVFVFRLVDLQIVSAAALNEEAKDKRAVPVTIPSLRGDIVDRNGEVLATTDERYDVQLSPKNTRLNNGKFYRPKDDQGVATVEVTAEQAFAEIGEITGQSAEEIEKIVDDALEKDPKSDFAYVKRAVDLSSLNRLKELRIPWLTFESHHTRTYPNGAVAGNIIGFSGFEDVPQSGVEVSQDACLTGEDGAETYERGADGVPLPGSVVVTNEAVNGGTVELTIDRDLNWQAQQIVNAKVEEHKAEWARAVVMDIKTGELLAVAEDGSVDPNDVDAGDPAKREARSFVDPYEPGSTFKTITAAALINEGVANASTRNHTPDYWEPEPGVRFRDSFAHPPMNWTLAGIMANSSNVGISALGRNLSEDTRYRYLQEFGIGTATEAGMPVESPGTLHPVEEWDRQTSYNTMFGQGLSSTIVQTAGVYQTIANGGVRVPPSIVRSCTDADGTEHVLDHGEPVKVISESAADQVVDLLETAAAQEWIQDTIDLPGYRIAGKTGTAEQSDGQGGYRADYVHSFATVFPAEDPQYVAVASIGYPKSGNGGVAAVSTVGEVIEAMIRNYNLPPSSGEFDPLPLEY